jgi:hypothetical protein
MKNSYASRLCIILLLGFVCLAFSILVNCSTPALQQDNFDSPRHFAYLDSESISQSDLLVPSIHYSEYGAKGDGITDDFDAIIAAHEAANRIGAKVYADAGAVYYIGGENKTARIETDTDWTGAKFIIDDSAVKFNESIWLDSWIFDIASVESSYQITSVQTLRKNQEKIDFLLPSASLLVAIDNTTKRYIRRGANANNGSNQTDVFIVDEDGNVDPSSPIIWDFNSISSLTVYPIDQSTLTVKGGQFTTIANKEDAGSYMKRGIRILRSNTVINGLLHLITGEGEQGAPYNGFIKLENCSNVTIKNTTLSGHRVYEGRGTYDISANCTINMSVINCDQTNDITNSYWWGIFASNVSKNILFDGVKFSRFDAHMGVYNTTILNSELGRQGVSIIGSGLLRIENTKVSGATNFIYFRTDYGSTWEGEVIIRNCVFAPGRDLLNTSCIIYTNNNGRWNFGYPCYMPETIRIDGFIVEDSSPPRGYDGVLLIGAVNSDRSEPYPFTLTKTIYLSGFVSSKSYRMPNDYIKNNIGVVER